LRCKHVGLRDIALLLRLLDGGLRGRLMLQQLLLAREVLLRLQQRGLRALQLRLRRGRRCLKLRRIDLIEQGAFLDVLPALKADALQNAGHLCFDVDGLDRLHVPDEFAGAGQFLRMHGERDDGRRRRVGGRCALRQGRRAADRDGDRRAGRAKQVRATQM